ncbi:signal peptide peptidase SppA [Frankia sp. R82]|uniref:signal peptide peptidase SppA n=1 Tax=Frankia sp. R82 TaxID=2950553 RepID=UPI002042F5E6|nr:signal peptide peptidase SppA [Frankia sp. R82]MCM3887263.1 signal peptide peptidase SppA [Frankia sp. R82]
MAAIPRKALADVRQIAARRTAPVVLELDLTADLLEGVPVDPVAFALARRRSTLRDLIEALRHAADDPRVPVVVAHIAACGMPLANIQEIRAAISAFRSAGGTAIAYADTFGEFGGGTGSYYLASAFDEIWLAPCGDCGLTGLGMETPFLRGALDRLGVTVEIGQRYEYKNAVNTLVERDFTPAHLEAVSRIIESSSEQVVAGIAQGRSMPADRVRRLIDLGPLTGSVALDTGLVDRLGYRDEVYAAARARVSVSTDADTDSGEATEPVLMYASAYRRLAERKEKSPVRRVTALAARGPGALFLREDAPQRSHGTESGPADVEEERSSPLSPSVTPAHGDPRRSVVALIYGTGPVVLGSGTSGPFSGPVLASEPIAAALRAAARDENVAAAVLRVSSPGGSYVASDLIRREAERFRASGRPLIVSMGDVAASGGYFVALAADEIVANPGTLTGSIGVFAGKQVVRELLDKVGVGFGAVAEGEHALMMSPRRPFTAGEREKLEEFLDRVYADFVDKVATSRRLSRDRVHELARGRVWTGADAYRHGLVDELGGLSDALRLAWSRADLPADETPRVRLALKPSVLDRVRTPRSSEDRGAAAVGLSVGSTVGSAFGSFGWGSFAPLAARLGLPVAGPLTMPPMGRIG